MNHAIQKARMPWQEDRPIFWGIVIALGISFLGGMATPLTDWYYGLDFPGWKPPDWAFGPAWTTIFILSTYAGVTAWQATAPEKRRMVLYGYLLNGGLNVTWSILFFTLRRPDLALYEIPVLLASIIVMMGLAAPAGRLSMAAVLPYLVWVSYAGLLNWSIVERNGPF